MISVLAVIAAVRRPEMGRRAWLGQHRNVLAVWAAVALGTLALLSSANRGFWFATPLDVLIVVGAVATGVRLMSGPNVPSWAPAIAAVPAFLVVSWAGANATMRTDLTVLVLVITVTGLTVLSPTRRPVFLTMAAGTIAALTLVASVPFDGPIDQFGDNGSAHAQIFGGLERYQHTVYEGDSRLLSPSMTVRRHVADEWAASAQELDRRLLELETEFGAGVPAFGVLLTGSRPLFDGNAIGVARELGPRGSTTHGDREHERPAR